jgi:hypothetical protein
MLKKILGLCLFLTSALASCYIDAEEKIPDDLASGKKRYAAAGERMALLIVTDGLKEELLEHMMEAGELPNFKKYIYNRAAVSHCAVTSAPSVTYPNLTAMVTGQYGSHSGVAGMKYIFREELQYRRYDRYSDIWKVNEDCTSPIIMEVLNDEYTFVNFFPLFRGAGHYARMFYNTLRAKVFGRWDLYDAACCENIAHVFENCHKEAGRYPRYTILYFIGSDAYAHKYGLASKEYREYLKYLDDRLGEMFRRLDKVGVLKDMLIVHISDHGMVDVNPASRFNLLSAMRNDLGMKVTNGDIPSDLSLKERLDRYNYFNAVVTVSGDRHGYIYLASEPPNRFRSVNIFAKPVPLEQIRNYEVSEGRRIDLIAALLKYDAVEHVLARKNESTVAVFHRNGEAEIERKIVDGKKMYRYKVVAGADPFAYNYTDSASKMKGDTFYTADEWLEATCDTEFPDAVVQCIEVFDSPDRVGDLVVYSRPFRELNTVHKSAHGGLHRGEMRIPLAFAGPGIRQCRFGPVRNVDVMPTILEYLGYGDRLEKLQNLDGKSFLRRIAAPQK